MNIQNLIQKASVSPFQLWKLNRILWIGIPFNKPHRFKILKIQKGNAQISIPFRKSNLNHIKTLHACSMATCIEYTSGLVLGTYFSFDEYRLIMKEINIKYHYQGKMDAYCEYQFTEDDFSKVLAELKNQDNTDIQAEVKCFDMENNLLASGLVIWQIKPWSKTKK